jgi:dolichol-phosphate mannosyltransferase
MDQTRQDSRLDDRHPGPIPATISRLFTSRGQERRERKPDIICDLSVVVPLFNEEESLCELHRRLHQTLSSLGLSYEVLLINDGSRDDTARLIDDLRRRDPNIVAIHLSRNFGHQAAVSAGIDHARGRAVVLMDGDLQDPPEILVSFIDRWRAGFEVVYAIRQARKEGWLKRSGYHAFYRLLGAISEIDIPLDSGDFCLMDRSVVDVLKHLPERMRFVRGLRSFVGFRQVGLPYQRAARIAGTPKYTFRGLIGLAIDGLISFSSYPLRLVTYLGMITIVVAVIMLVWVFVDAFYNHTGPRGWASVIVTLLFMGSIQLFCLGIVGEYVRLIFLESKGRPTYIVRDYQGHDSEGNIHSNEKVHLTRSPASD